MQLPVVQVRTKNAIYKCAFEEKFYNAHKLTAYAVMFITGVSPNPQNPGQFTMNAQSILICKNCYEKNLGSEGLEFKEVDLETNITPEAIHKLNSKKN